MYPDLYYIFFPILVSIEALSGTADAMERKQWNKPDHGKGRADPRGGNGGDFQHGRSLFRRRTGIFPHIIQRPFSPYVMVKHNAFPVLHTLFHLGAKGLFVDVICPIKIQQIQMRRFDLSDRICACRSYPAGRKDRNSEY